MLENKIVSKEEIKKRKKISTTIGIFSLFLLVVVLKIVSEIVIESLQLNINFDGIYAIIATILYIFLSLILTYYLLSFMFKYKYFKTLSLKQTFNNYRFTKNMKDVFKKQRIYISVETDSENNIEIVRYPKIKFLKDNGIAIENLHSVSEKIANLKSDINAALSKDYRVEEYKLDKSRKFYVVQIKNKKEDENMIYRSLDGFFEYIKHFKNEEIVISKGYTYNALKSPHILVSGVTGSGKTYFLYNIILANIVHENIVYIIDRKKDLSRFSKVIGNDKVATELEDIISLINKIYDDLLETERTIENLETDKLSVDFRDLTTHYKLTYVVIDEYASIINELDKKQRENLVKKIKYIAQRGRSAGFNLVIAMQQANANTLSTEIRDQLGFKVVLGSSDKTTRSLVLNDNDVEDIDLKTGQGLYRDSSSTSSKYITSPFFDFDFDYKDLKKKVVEEEINQYDEDERKAYLRELYLEDVEMRDND